MSISAADYGPHTASVHACLAAQSEATWHCGWDSPGVKQTPLWQITAAPHKQQSALVAQGVRQAALMQACPELQSAFVRHPGFGRVSAWHMPSRQRSSGPQSPSVAHEP
jgi:hypothetical protein